MTRFCFFSFKRYFCFKRSYFQNFFSILRVKHKLSYIRSGFPGGEEMCLKKIVVVVVVVVVVVTAVAVTAMFHFGGISYRESHTKNRG